MCSCFFCLPLQEKVTRRLKHRNVIYSFKKTSDVYMYGNRKIIMRLLLTSLTRMPPNENGHTLVIHYPNSEQ
jgi:hypothetical protein